MTSQTEPFTGWTTGYRWNLRKVMASRDLWQAPPMRVALAEHGVHLSEAQTYRLVYHTPTRLNLRTMAALCQILSCTPSDLVQPCMVPPTTTKESD